VSIRTIDNVKISDSQWMGWCADDERGQTPQVRVSNIEGFPFHVTTPSGEPIKAYRSFKLAAMARSWLMGELFE
jgi:hypothetical protein